MKKLSKASANGNLNFAKKRHVASQELSEKNQPTRSPRNSVFLRLRCGLSSSLYAEREHIILFISD